MFISSDVIDMFLLYLYFIYLSCIYIFLQIVQFIEIHWKIYDDCDIYDHNNTKFTLYYPYKTEEDLIKNSLCSEEAFMNHRNDFDTVSITLSNQYSEIKNSIRRIILARLFQNAQLLNSLNMNNKNC